MLVSIYPTKAKSIKMKEKSINSNIFLKTFSSNPHELNVNWQSYVIWKLKGMKMKNWAKNKNKNKYTKENFVWQN